jgi:archaellum biogenesis protein FlaJ (TadC family)
MARLADDPGPLRWLTFALGFRLPEQNTDWVRHELTDDGWRLRTVLRHLAVIIPLCAIITTVLLVLLPAPAWLAVMMVTLILAGSIFSTTAYAEEIRASRLRQHGLETDDPDLGHPAR